MNSYNKRILLVEPPFYRLYKKTFSLVKYPLAIGYLTGVIRENTDWSVLGYNADFYTSGDSELMLNSYLGGEGFGNYVNNLKDLNSPIWKEIVETIRDYNPSIIGISAKTQNYASAINVAKIAKELNKDILVVMGGAHPSMVQGQVLQETPSVDICAIGEGERTIVDILTAFESGAGFEGVNGIVYRKNGVVLKTPPRQYIEDLDTLPFPYDYARETLKDFDRYPATAFKNVFATRGCPFNCVFCGSREIWSRKVRFRSPKNVAAELKKLKNAGITTVLFDDDTFGIKYQYIAELCEEIIRECPGLRWSCELHAKIVDEATIAVMKKAGCGMIQLGAESGNNEILKKARKSIKIEDTLCAANIIQKAGIELQTFWMIGLPWEEERHIRDTQSAIKNIKGAVSFSIFTPYPGTEVFDLLKEKGFIAKDHDHSLFNHQSPLNCFSMYIKLERFKVIASELEKIVDRKNFKVNLAKVFSRKLLFLVHDMGVFGFIRKSFRYVISMLRQELMVK